MPHRELNNANAVKRMTELFAFGEFWRRLSHLSKFNTCQWHSACTKFGHSNNFATLSLSLSLSLSLRYSPTVAHTLLRFAGTRASIYGFSCNLPSFGAASAKANLFALCRVATKLDRRSREAALFFVPLLTSKQIPKHNDGYNHLHTRLGSGSAGRRLPEALSHHRFQEQEAGEVHQREQRFEGRHHGNGD